MEHLQLQADWFRRHGKLWEDKMETIIEELKRDTVAEEDKGREEEAKRLEEHQRVLEAVNEGLLQVHGIAPNSKKDRMF
jgi:hypothetical protein